MKKKLFNNTCIEFVSFISLIRTDNVQLLFVEWNQQGIERNSVMDEKTVTLVHVRLSYLCLLNTRQLRWFMMARKISVFASECNKAEACACDLSFEFVLDKIFK